MTRRSRRTRWQPVVVLRVLRELRILREWPKAVTTERWQSNPMMIPPRCYSACLLLLLSLVSCAPTQVSTPSAPARRLSADDERFLEDLSRRTFAFFWEQADPKTGIVRDRSQDGRRTGQRERAQHRQHCLGRVRAERAVHRGRARVAAARRRDRSRRDDAAVVRGDDAARARLVLPFRAARDRRAGVAERAVVDRQRAAAGGRAHGPALLRRRSRGRPLRRCDLPARRLSMDARRRPIAPRARLAAGVRLPALALGSLLRADDPVRCSRSVRRRTPFPPASWRAWSRPIMRFQDYTYVSGPDPLFVHQYSHAWIDFRGRREFGARTGSRTR